MDVLVKVDKVKSVAEALELEKLGVKMLCVSIEGNSIFSDDRVIDLETAVSIRKAIGKDSKLIGEVLVASKPGEVMQFTRRVGFDFIQINEPVKCPPRLENELSSNGVGIVYGNISADHDDDPEWVLSRYEGAKADFFQIGLLNEFENAWEFLKKDSPQFPDELQIPDIVDLGTQKPILISLDFTPENLQEIVEQIPSSAGIFFSLRPDTNMGDLRTFDIEQVLLTLQGSVHS